MIFVYVAVVSYLLGSIPFGYLIARIQGIDIRKHGSGNIGATNVLRTLGKGYGLAVFVSDALKGFVPVRIAVGWAAHSDTPSPFVLPLIAAGFAILGHSFPIWLRFKGGKGVATSAGACLGMVPIAVVLVGAVWVMTFLLSRIVSLASLVAAVSLPLALCVVPAYRSKLLLSFGVAIALLIILRHHANIRRLLAGTEPRFVRK